MYYVYVYLYVYVYVYVYVPSNDWTKEDISSHNFGSFCKKNDAIYRFFPYAILPILYKLMYILTISINVRTQIWIIDAIRIIILPCILRQDGLSPQHYLKILGCKLYQ